jgi:2-amino-4-hydroxy-6-hydroxymethyldihydropteridine diphosphokinase
MATVFLSLGSNLGNRERHLKEAKNAILHEVGEIITESSIYESKSDGFEGNSFLNQVIKINTTLLPELLLQKTEEIERKLGRTKKTYLINAKPVYHNRVIDIDILLYDNLQIDREELTLPHPRIFEREFVMKPLKELVDTEW